MSIEQRVSSFFDMQIEDALLRPLCYLDGQGVQIERVCEIMGQGGTLKIASEFIFMQMK